MKSSIKGFLLSHRLTKNAYCDLFKLSTGKRAGSHVDREYD